MIDFGTEHPEVVRGVRAPEKINWDALELVVRTTEGTEFEKRWFRQKFFKAIKKHGLVAMKPWFRYHYACARLALGDFSDYWGWEFRGLQAQDEGGEWAARMFWEETWLPKWGGGDVARLLVLGEQGVGDQVFFGSMLPECLLRAKEVIFECDERLHTMFSRMSPRLKCAKERHFEDRRTDYGQIDAFIPAAELMRMFRRDKSHFPAKPYLKPDPLRVENLEMYRGRVGISWTGRQGCIDPLSLGLKAPVSLQYNEVHEDIETPPINLKDDLEGVLALCSVLEKVVTVPTSVHHLAGAVGTRVEIIVPEEWNVERSRCAWDYSTHYGGKLPWYPNAQVFESVEAWRV